MPTPPPPTQPSIKIVKTSFWKAGQHEWSNRYFFSGGTPADAGHWTTLSDAVVAAEALALPVAANIIQAVGYAAGSEVPVHIKTYSTLGSATPSGTPCPGEVAALVRYTTTARSVKNHPIYLFNYYHAMYSQGTTGRDSVDSVLLAALGTYATKWDSTGFSDGTITVKRTGPYGHNAIAHLVEPYLTHRDFR